MKNENGANAGVTPARLMEEARKYRERAYAPYSSFSVGAALLMDDGTVFGGCNVENTSFGLSICAERNAMTSAVAAGNAKPVAIAVAGEDGSFCAPCGACRQFLAEFNPEMQVILKGESGIVSYVLADLLPKRFVLEGH